jgi:hypothetical protein
VPACLELKRANRRNLETRPLRRGDVTCDRCGQDDKSGIDHNPIRNHVTSSFDFGSEADAALDTGRASHHTNVDRQEACAPGGRWQAWHSPDCEPSQLCFAVQAAAAVPCQSIAKFRFCEVSTPVLASRLLCSDLVPLAVHVKAAVGDHVTGWNCACSPLLVAAAFRSPTEIRYAE